MKKVEIVLSQALEDDFLLYCKANKVGTAYTRINNVCGEGLQVPKLGTPIWPQLNSYIIIVCSESEAEVIASIVQKLRQKYPDDGIFAFSSTVDVI